MLLQTKTTTEPTMHNIPDPSCICNDNPLTSGQMVDPAALIAYLRRMHEALEVIGTQQNAGCPTPTAQPHGGCTVDQCDFIVGATNDDNLAIAAGATVTFQVEPATPVDVQYFMTTGLDSLDFDISQMKLLSTDGVEGRVPSDIYNPRGGAAGGPLPMRVGVISKSHPLSITVNNNGGGPGDFLFAFLGIGKGGLSRAQAPTQ